MLMILILLLAINFIKGQCNEGCLKCEKNNTCSLCDLSNDYYLNKTLCQRATQEKCASFNQNGECVLCETGYYIERTSLQCVLVSLNLIVVNCLRYSFERICVQCIKSHIVSDGACIPLTSVVSRCQKYEHDGICGACETGYIPSKDKKRCLQFSPISNCEAYTFSDCTECKSGYFFNRNSYAMKFNSLENLLSLTRTNSTFLSSFKNIYCQQKTIPFCKNFTAFNICQSCNDNYFLQKNICHPNPHPVISNCSKYSSLTACTECAQNFYLKNGECTANEPIENCLEYDSAATSNKCKRCKPDFYLSSSNCKKRSVTISDCFLMAANAETCQECRAGFLVTNDNLLCLSSISNCQTYKASDSSSTFHKCQTCRDYFYRTETSTESTCLQGGVQNCKIYGTVKTQCLTCSYGFYLAEGKCLESVTLQNCATTSSSISNFCDTCNSGYYKFIYDKVCTPANKVQNCQIHNNLGTACTSCKNGYFLENSSTCSVIPQTMPNCNQITAGSCSQCKPNYVLNKYSPTGGCSTVVEYLSLNCHSIDTSSSINCLNCKENAYYLKPLNQEAICIKTSEFNLFSPKNLDSNCIRYGLSTDSSNKIICMECLQGYFLSDYWPNKEASTLTFCVNTCDTSSGNNIQIYEDLLGFKNICVPAGNASSQFTFTGCQYVARKTVSTANSEIDYICILMSNSYVPVFTISHAYENHNTQKISALSLSTASNVFTTGWSLISSKTTTLSAFNVHGLILTPTSIPESDPANGFQNCAVFFNIPASNFIGSIKTSGGALGGAYAEFIGSGHGCLRCVLGYQLTFTGTLPSNNANLPTCVSMGSTCESSSIIYGGLPSFLQATISCHSCKFISAIPHYPTIYYEYDAARASTGTGNFLNYSLPSISNIGENHGFRCARAPSLVVTSSAAPSQSVSNCAIFGDLSSQTSSRVTPTATNSFCLACASGYFPIYLANYQTIVTIQPSYAPSYTVTSCQTSNKCDFDSINKPYNSCGKCSRAEESLNLPKYYAFSDFRLINCLPVTTANCFIISESSPSLTVASKCQICLNGYFLNADFICDKLEISNMETGGSFASNFYNQKLSVFSSSKTGGYDRNWVRVHYLLTFLGNQNGVSACKEGYTKSAPSLGAQAICAKSSYLSNSALVSSTNFIKKCVSYKFSPLSSGKLQCSVCISGNTPNNLLSACENSLNECELILHSDPTKCQKCRLSLINQSGVCKAVNLDNCKTLINTNIYSTSDLSCQQCSSGYYISVKDGVRTCKKGSIPNCDRYQDSSAVTCLNCLQRFILLSVPSFTTYCFPIPQYFYNCILLENSAATQGVLGLYQGYMSCESCHQTEEQIFSPVAWTSLTNSVETQPKTFCAPFTQTKNCKLYNQANTMINNNHYQCVECQESHFLKSDASCEERSYISQNCQTYELNSDKCQICKEGFFLSSNTFICFEYPKGIQHCSIYSDAKTCTECLSGRYIKDNICVAPETKIDNCSSYLNSTNCSKCDPSYFLEKNTCVFATANNCLTFANSTACATCAVGSGLFKGPSSVDCIPSTIPNCLQTSLSFPFQCLTCEAEYFPSTGGICQSVSSTITNCQAYDTTNTCKKCSAGFILNSQRTSCQNAPINLDSNCNNLFYNSIPNCLICKPGFYFQNGICKSAAPIGCFASDFYKQTSCLVCQSGYSMNQAGKCSINPQVVRNSTFNETAFLKIIKLTFILSLLLIPL